MQSLEMLLADAFEKRANIDRAKDENDNRTNGIIEVAGAQATDTG